MTPEEMAREFFGCAEPGTHSTDHHPRCCGGGNAKYGCELLAALLRSEKDALHASAQADNFQESAWHARAEAAEQRVAELEGALMEASEGLMDLAPSSTFAQELSARIDAYLATSKPAPSGGRGAG